MTIRRCLAGMTMAMALAACSSSGGSGDRGGGGNIDCTPASLGSAPTFNAVQKSGSLPTAAGGALQSGTYYLTEVDYYPGASTHNYQRQVLVLDTAAGVAKVYQDDKKGFIATMTTSGNNVVFNARAGFPGRSRSGTRQAATSS